MINRRALFSDETENFKIPYEPFKGDQVTLKMRTLKNDVLGVFVIINGIKRRMEKMRCRSGYDYYTYSFTCPDRKVSYFFNVYDDDENLYFNRLGPNEVHRKEGDFSFEPGFHVPDWAKGIVFYQIFTDRFCNGDETNDVTDNEYYYTGGHSRKVKDWNKMPEELDVRYFYGGDLQGVRSKLDYLQELGVEAIYFNPLFVSPSNHKYDTQDYDHIDPHLAVIEDDMVHPMKDWEQHNGYAPRYIRRVTSQENLEKSNEYFRALVEEIHARGMKVVIDGVFNHCGSFNKWMDKEGIYLNKPGFELGAYQSVDSPYRSYFRFKHPHVDKSDYEGWWGIQTLPKLNYENSQELEDYILSTGAKWVSAPFNVDGWRLDVAADLGHSQKYNHAFWKKFRESVRSANPDAFIFAEHYGSPAAWFDGRQWDSVMNYDAFMEPVTWFLTGMEKHSETFDAKKAGDGNLFFRAMIENMSKFPRPSLDSALNQLSNHDHSRFLTRTNKTPGTLKSKGSAAASEGTDIGLMQLGVLIQMTWPGNPGIYYADEAGQVGWTDPDSRRTYPWGHENKVLIEFHKHVIALRKSISCLKMGSVMQLAAGQGYIAYARFDKTDCAVVAINQTDKDLKVSLPVWDACVPEESEMMRVFACTPKGFEDEALPRKVAYGRMQITMPAKGGVVYHYVYKPGDLD
ncbi:MAG: glycoside hydrolase family 13 protein [Clostridia bacterium]|nr:glycoside hydrolase family 13 protein [Clostridia bacterium]